MAASPSIVLAHGFPMDAAMWRPQAEFLTAHGYHVLTPNFPGFGGTTPWPSKKYSMEALAAELRDVIQTQAKGPVVVGGFSMGGYVLLALLKESPELVHAAMFLDTRADADTDEQKANRAKMVQAIEAGGAPAAADAMIPRLLSKDAPQNLRDQARAIALHQHPDALIGAQQAMAKRYDHTNLLPTLNIPALVLVGAFDAVSPPNIAMAMHNNLRHSTLVQIAKAGHLANLEQPDAVNRSLLMFMKIVEKRMGGGLV